MREILFRGKRSLNGEWIKGFFEKYNVGDYLNVQIDELNSGGYPIRQFIKVIINDVIRFANEYGVTVDYMLGRTDTPYYTM